MGDIDSNESNHKIKNKKLEFGIIFIAIALAVIYFYPKVITLIEEKQNAVVKENCRVFVSKILEKTVDSAFVKDKKNKKIKPDLEKISQETMKELNPDGKKIYGEEKCPLCCRVEFDNKTNTIIITGYDNTAEVLSRTVINPPSFVRYER